MSTSFENVPGSALRFRGDVRFGQFATKPIVAGQAAGEPDGDEVEAGDPVDIDLTLLSGEPISHPWWGMCMFDISGMGTHKDTFALDYCHDAGEIVGQFSDVTPSACGELTAKGKVIPFASDDRASEIIFRAAAGTPYEASIFMDPNTYRVEFLDENQVAAVNGQSVQGPLAIIRNWDLRGAALCPAGADKFACAEFASSTFSIPTSGTRKAPPTVSTETTKTEAGKPAAVETAAATFAVETKTAEQLRAVDAKHFTDAFGLVDGAAYFAAGKTFEAAAGEFAQKLRTENEQLKQRLAGAQFAGAVDAAGKIVPGETAALSAGDATPDKNALSPLQSKYGKNVGAFMAACMPPKK